MTAYQALHSRFRQVGLLREAGQMLEWDSSTLMPEGSAAGRAEQVAALQLTIHEKLIDARVSDWLADADADNTLDAWQRANLHEMQRQYVHATSVPADLLEAASMAASECEIIWRRARPANDFKLLLPSLQRVLDTVRETGQAKAAALGCSLYDALLDQYEPGGHAADIDVLFGKLATFLPGLITAALDRQASAPPPLPLDGPFPIASQEALGRRLMQTLGFDFERGRLDVSLHPFCGGTSEDVRITTRYRDSDFASALMGVLHETGHALYEFGLPADWRYQPVGKARGMSLHESQSLLMEMQACRSREFFEFAAPLIREAFQRSGPEFESENLYRLATRVERSLIRVHADEATYPAHVILRYRLERQMLAGDLPLADLPEAWRAGMLDLIGVSPSNDADGCMQDIHWPCGAWGYFPTYTMGAMTAAQLFDAAKRAVPGIEAGISRGDFSPLLGWLRTHVHGKASSLPTAEIVTTATGKPLDVGVFRQHLERRYVNTP
jgi:carboxypeptidase Taq